MHATDFKNWVMTLNTTDKLTLIATVATLIAVLIAIWQLRDTNKTTKGQCWLMLRGVMTQYDDIHANFRPRGKWHASKMQPATVNDWARTELYMGLIEYCNWLIGEGLLDSEHFKKWYEYRIKNLLLNPRVVKYKLHDNAAGWTEFYDLCERRLAIKIPKPIEGLPPFIRADDDATHALTQD